MAVKYQCTKCGRRYIEWGAEKLKFHCPCADGAELVRIGSPEDKAKKPSLKRAVRRPAPARRAAPVDENEEIVEVDDDVQDVDEEVDEEVEEVEVEVEVVEDVLEDDIDDEDADELVDDEEEEEVEVVEDLDFSDISSALPAKPDHDEDEDWNA